MFLRSASCLVVLCLIAARQQPANAQEASWKSFQEMHGFYTEVFEERPGFGPSRLVSPGVLKRSQLARLEESRRSNRKPAILVHNEPYVLTEQNLIGLNRKKPVVFLATDQRMMTRDEIDSYKTRALTNFEKQAVAELRAGKPVSHQSNLDRSRYTVVGALRAKKSCASCHQVPEDTLLGAFVFSLTRVEPKYARNADLNRQSSQDAGQQLGDRNNRRKVHLPR